MPTLLIVIVASALIARLVVHKSRDRCSTPVMVLLVVFSVFGFLVLFTIAFMRVFP